MKQKLFLLFWAIVACAATTWAVPAKPGWYTHTQSDGKTVTFELVGDEYSSARLTRDGMMIYQNEDGDYYYYSSLTGRTAIKAHDMEQRTAVETTFIEAQRTNLKFKYERKEDAFKQRFTAPNRSAGSEHDPICQPTDTRKIAVLLVDFEGTEFHFDADVIKSQMTDEVTRYFYDQSNGAYTPEFTVNGPYHLPHNYAYYGAPETGKEDGDDDNKVREMVRDAIDLAVSNEVDFNFYSQTNKSIYGYPARNYLDAVIVIYAGYGEASGGEKNTLWPCSGVALNVNNTDFYPITDNLYAYQFGIFNELNFRLSNKEGHAVIAGIGTFCHEFSHCLGLPDFYDTDKSDGKDLGNMCNWSLMDHGSYNDNERTPVGYDAYEKNFMGWIEYVEAKPGTYYTLPVWNQGSKDTDVAICIKSDVCENEYFLYEYRKKQGWDAEIGQEEGILVTHVSYVPDRWSHDAGSWPNDHETKLMTFLPYDGIRSRETENQDLWGTAANSSITSATLYLNSDGTVNSGGNAGTFNMGVTEMNIEHDHNSAHFWFKKESAKTLNVNPRQINFGNVSCGTSLSIPVTVTSQNIDGVISLRVIQTPAHWPQEFSANESSIICTPDGYTFNVTYTPPQFALPADSHHTGFLEIHTNDAVTTIPLSGSCYISNDEDGDGIFDVHDITAGIDKMMGEENSSSGESMNLDIITAMIDDILNGETTVNLENDLVAHYPLDGNTNDISGNGNNGIGYNISYTKGVTGDDNGACRFGGVDSPGYIKVPNSESLKFTDGFTFTCYFKPMGWKGKNSSSTVMDYGSHCIFAKSNTSTGPALMFKGSSDGLRTWSETTGTQNQWASIDSEDLLPNDNYLNKWVHVAITYSKSKKQARLYVNGVLVKQKHVMTDIDYTQMNGKDLYLGQFLGSSMMNPMNGALDEVRIYNRYLGPTEIHNISVQFKKDLRVRLSASEVVMNVGDVVRVDIINGGGDYSVGSNPEVVDFQLAGESIILTGMSEGSTNVTFIDLESDTYILLPVTVTKAIKNYTVNGVTFTMIPVPGGTFTMGATAEQGSDAAANEKPAHQVTLSNYLIGQTEVTQALWQAVMGSNPSYFTGNLSCPVEQVSWQDCQEFISRLNALTGESFRLPTEAEWEYAARGDGVSVHYKYAGGNNISEVAWWGCGYDEDSPLGNSAFTTHPVGLKKPNELGLYDMSGNVYEWCYDWYASYSSAAQTNPTGPASGTNRVTRGGGWGYGDVNCRVSHRMSSSPTYRHPCQGLRLAL